MTSDGRAPDLIAIWIRNAKLVGEAQFLDRLVHYNAEAGWRAVLAIHRLSTGGDSLRELARWFGPVERLLKYHGDLVIDRVEELAASDARFRSLLDPLQESRDVRPDLLERIGRICGWQPRPRRDPAPQIASAVNIAQIDIAPPKTKEDWQVIDAARSDGDMMALAQAWLEQRATRWASEEVDELVHEGDRTTAWQTILALIAATPDDETLAFIGAGVLEDFLDVSGEEWIDEIELAAARDERVRRALRGSWRRSMSAELWRRVRAAATESAS